MYESVYHLDVSVFGVFMLPVDYFVFFQTNLSFVVLDKDTNAIKMIKDERGDFMGSCNLSLTEVSLKTRRRKKQKRKKYLHALGQLLNY